MKTDTKKQKIVPRLDGRIEIQCIHGVGHTTYESAVRCADYYGEYKNGSCTREKVIDAWLSHGCCQDQCCKNFKECRKPQ